MTYIMTIDKYNTKDAEQSTPFYTKKSAEIKCKLTPMYSEAAAALQTSDKSSKRRWPKNNRTTRCLGLYPLQYSVSASKYLILVNSLLQKHEGVSACLQLPKYDGSGCRK
jgi:hypothetical protein